MPAPSSPRFSRRAFLKGSAAAAAAGGTVGAESAHAATDTALPDPALNDARVLSAADLHEVELTINGEARKLHVQTRTTLLDALRDGLDMTGTKKVCDRGACGGCTVLLDGHTANSCMTLAIDAAGTAVRTIEGLATGDALHPMQTAFVECDALQCGFCTPGMVMSAVACVEHRGGTPTDAQMREDMAGNLCRCGTYTRVFEAIRTASRNGDK